MWFQCVRQRRWASCTTKLLASFPSLCSKVCFPRARNHLWTIFWAWPSLDNQKWGENKNIITSHHFMKTIISIDQQRSRRLLKTPPVYSTTPTNSSSSECTLWNHPPSPQYIYNLSFVTKSDKKGWSCEYAYKRYFWFFAATCNKVCFINWLTLHQIAEFWLAYKLSSSRLFS